MTEASAPDRVPEAAEFLQLWRDSFSEVLGQIAGAAVPCLVEDEAPAGLPPASEKDLWIVTTTAGALRGEMSLRLESAAVLRLAQMFMGEPPAPEAALTPEHPEAVIELLRQVSGVVATSARARWGEVQLLAELAPAAPSWPAAEAFWLRLGEEGPNAVVLEAGLSAALVASLKAEKMQAAEAEAAIGSTGAPAEAASESANPPPEPPPPPDLPEGAGALDLLMDVRLAMTMRFGARTLLLREVLDLSPGSVVELDRKVNEPVELLLDGRLLARGEVVVIEGNYGLRVTDVSLLGPG